MDRTFGYRHGVPEAEGFKLGQRVTMLVKSKGADHDDIEHTVPQNADALIECIEMLPPPQGLAFTLWIPVNEPEDRGIVNVIDQTDGHITTFIAPKETS